MSLGHLGIANVCNKAELPFSFYHRDTLSKLCSMVPKIAKTLAKLTSVASVEHRASRLNSSVALDLSEFGRVSMAAFEGFTWKKGFNMLLLLATTVSWPTSSCVHGHALTSRLPGLRYCLQLWLWIWETGWRGAHKILVVEVETQWESACHVMERSLVWIQQCGLLWLKTLQIS